MISILDYGLGNVLAFQNVFKRLGIAAGVASRSEHLTGSTKLILPGVGSFDNAMELFEKSGLRGPVEELVRVKGMPVIGVCVGMQMLAEGSEEGERTGLGWIAGRVKKFDITRLTQAPKLPHMGWNDVRPLRPCPLLHRLETGARFYFLHSYYFAPESMDTVLAVAEYGGEFACVVGRDNIYGVQFHPEKSHHFGEQLLKNFAEIG